MDHDKLLASIVIPCYNHEKFIIDCLNSIISQKYSNIELIICDDASQDKSWEMINSYYPVLIQKLNHVIIMKNEKNQGITKTLNRMIKASSGDFIKVLASDDVLKTDCIDTFADEFAHNENIGVLICNGLVIEEDDHDLAKKDYEKIYQNVPFVYNDKMLEQIYKDNIFFAPGAMIRKEIYTQCGLYDENIQVEDWEFWLRILSKTNTEFGFVNKELVYYRKSSNSMTSTMHNPTLEKRRIILHKSEISILKKYGNCVSAETEAFQIINRIIGEQSFAYKNGYVNLLNLTKREFHEYKMWKKLSFSDLKVVIYRIIFMKRKKNF